MANEEHLQMLKRGVQVWNAWREENPGTYVDLTGADLLKADLTGANLGTNVDLTNASLSKANLSKANLSDSILSKAYLTAATLTEADLRGALLTEAVLNHAILVNAKLGDADLSEANLTKAILTEADLTGARLFRADLGQADFTKAILVDANLIETTCVGTILNGAILHGACLSGTLFVDCSMDGADLTDCRVFGTSVWNASLQGAIQTDLVITRENEPMITVDNLQVAQFIYLFLNNENIRGAIDTITSKVVLILGPFRDRKPILDAIRAALRMRDYSPVMFDFTKPLHRNMTETIRVLAGLARFVIVDLSEARCVPQELQAIVPDFPSLPVQPLLDESEGSEYGMFSDFLDYRSVLDTFRYRDLDHLLESLGDRVIGPAEEKVREIWGVASPGSA